MEQEDLRRAYDECVSRELSVCVWDSLPFGGQVHFNETSDGVLCLWALRYELTGRSLRMVPRDRRQLDQPWTEHIMVDLALSLNVLSFKPA